MTAATVAARATAPGSLPPPQPPEQRRTVVFHHAGAQGSPAGHDVLTKRAVAQRLARLMGSDFGGDFDGDLERWAPPGAPPLYVVPTETLCDVASAMRLGIRGVADLFGGVVPQPFVATKVISHPLVRPDAAAPRGWSVAFGSDVASAVLPGWTVFDPADLRSAAEQMLRHGAVRLKDPAGVGGVGQWVVHDGPELEARLSSLDPQAVRSRGLVLERNLNGVVTHSVGQVQVGSWRAAYCGVQNTTVNHRGVEVYGGSDLRVARGGFEQLLQLPLAADVRLTVEQALQYHRAALTHFDGLFASRCNYDVAQGSDDSGNRLSGVLEQSWRIGGASGAEVAALEALAADPGLQTVRASTCERYGDDASAPAGAWVLFDGIDPRVGRIVKYAQALPDGHV